MKIACNITLITIVSLAGTAAQLHAQSESGQYNATATATIPVGILKMLKFERLDNPIFDMFSVGPGRTIKRNAKSANALKYRLTGHPGMTVNVRFPATVLLQRTSERGSTELITVYITDVRGKNTDHQGTSDLLGEASWEGNITLDETGIYYFWVGYEGEIPTANYPGVYTGSYLVTVDYFF